MIRIINARDEDLEAILKINQLNSSNPHKPPKEKEFCLYLYVRYYMEFEKENCFVALDDETDEVEGYILGAKDHDTYLSNIEKSYLKRAEELGFRVRFLYEIHSYEACKDDYPAHFHIDVRPGHQHKGIGTKLLETQIAHMRENRVKGLMLLVGKNKTAGNRFYEKNGFKVIEESEDSYARGKKL